MRTHPSPLAPRHLLSFDSDSTLDVGHRFAALIADYFARAARGEGAVSSPLDAGALDAMFDEPLPARGRPVEDVVARLRDQVVAHANRLSHPMYIGHQVSAPLPVAVWTDALVAALNQSIAVSEMSPSLTAVEGRVIRWMCELAGLGPASGGTFTSGGTEATFSALLAARAAVLPDAWTRGVGSDAPPVVLCGEHTHYAVARAVGQLGIGTDSLVLVPSREWRMDVDALARELDRLATEGRRVMAVVATAGSTATGSFDDLDAVADLCERHGAWMHVDAAHGGSALLSARHRHHLRGLERARSLAWDPHKMMLLPLAAGVLLVRNERDLEAAFAQRAPYLFHGGEEERVRDQGVRSFQCSRRADAMKAWVALQRHGAEGIGEIHDHLCDVAAELHAEIGRRAEFEALHAPESNILCFRWIGDGSRTDDELDIVNRELREAYNRSGQGWITTTVLGGRRVLRVTVMNPRTTTPHALAMLDGIAALGRTFRRR